MKNTIAVLLTCHNRKNKTLLCLESFFRASDSVKNINFDVFLVDDGSTDGTEKAIRLHYPNIRIIKGSGNLFWNQGMRLAWNTALKHNDYDFYVWLNDDTLLHKNAIEHLLDSYQEAITTTSKPSIIVGACVESDENPIFSYGGRNKKKSVEPNGEIQSCKYINGNIVLIPKEIQKQVGILSNDYTHGIGDYDYGLRAQQKGYFCYTTKEYIAICPTNKGIATWCDPNKTLKERKSAFYSPRGLNFKEYITFRKKFWPYLWVIFAIKAYVKLYFPAFYTKIASI